MKITGVHHIAIKAKGLEAYERLVSFYHELLGMPIVRSWKTADGGNACMVDTGAGMLELFSNAPDVLGAGALRHLALAVDDTDAFIEKVRAAGYKITMEPTNIVIGDDYPARIGFCIGPTGEEVEFFKELQGMKKYKK